MDISDSLPTDLTAAHVMIIAQRQALSVSEARAAMAESEAKLRALLIEKLKYTIAKLRHQQFGQSSERGAILDQLELQLSELQENAAEAEAAALPRERIVYPSPAACRAAEVLCISSAKMSPRRWS